MKAKFLFGAALLFLSAVHSSNAAQTSCHQSIGPQLAAKLVDQCRQVSPATRPPCNANNACEVVSSEIDRSCNLLSGGNQAPSFCTAQIKKQETLEGTLIAGGGIDDLSITIFTEDGRRVRAYCDGKCGDWFDSAEGSDETKLSPQFNGRKVVLSVTLEANKSRIAGPGTNEKLIFVKQVRLNK